MTVLFVSQLPLGRCENLTAVWEAYDGPKEFKLGQHNMRTAEHEGFSVVVCDALPVRIDGKVKCKLVGMDHGLTGGKLYALDEGDVWWVDRAALAQIDYAVSSSTAGVPITARMFGIPESCVLALGFPRTDRYFGRRAHGGEITYLYAPTFRNMDHDSWLPYIDWRKVDSLLRDGERFVVKRHYFTKHPLVRHECERVVEVNPMENTDGYLMACSALLTDYSSVMFDAYLMDIPCVLAIADMGEYLRDRGMYFEYPREYSSRFLEVEGHEEELLGMLRESARNGIGPVEERCRELTADVCDGRSTERVCGLISSLERTL